MSRNVEGKTQQERQGSRVSVRAEDHTVAMGKEGLNPGEPVSGGQYGLGLRG